MFSNIESFFHRLRRRLSRSEWAVHHLGLKVSEGTSEEPGLLLIQIDGFSRSQLEQAMAKGRMRFLRGLMQRNHYQLHTFYPGLPTTTAAVQAELYYGLRTAVPAFSFFNREKKELGRMLYPTWAKDVEAGLAAKAEGLLQGGSSWSNIYTGGAAQEDSHFCAASNGFGDMWRTGKIINIFIFMVMHLASTLRIAGLIIFEGLIALWDAMGGIRRGQGVGHELFVAMSRVFVSIGLRELITIGAKVDVARGLPTVHVNFLGYDEQSHARGPSSLFAHWCLRGIDRSIKELYRAAQRSNRRDYAVWVFSDHGQERTRSFATEVPGGIEAVVRDCYDRSRARDRAWRPRPQRRDSFFWGSQTRFARGRLKRLQAADALTAEEKATFTVVAVGPVGHIYFSTPLADDQRLALARRLVKDGKVPGVLLRTEANGVVWVHAGGETSVPGDVPALLPHPENLREEIARDLVGLVDQPHSGDLVLSGWSPHDRPWTFAEERGAHGGFGPEEAQGFCLLPARTWLPSGAKNFIRPSALRSAALHLLGREKAPLDARPMPTAQSNFRMMTYNVHGCGGMDGRVSPRRVARVINTYSPDIVALQEMDLGRRRSRAENQIELIAKALDMQFEFCPTVTVGEEHYGHALLSIWPMEVVKRARLPADPHRAAREPRAALWVRLTVNGQRLNVITTHLGLGIDERRLQMQALAGEEWLGSIPPHEAVLVCGDCNMLPGSVPYRLINGRLRDIQLAVPGRAALPTFSTTRPFARLDYIFASPHVAVKEFQVPRTDLTRVTSDHFPLLADLSVAPAAAGKTTTTPLAAANRKAPAPLSATA